MHMLATSLQTQESKSVGDTLSQFKATILKGGIHKTVFHFNKSATKMEAI